MIVHRVLIVPASEVQRYIDDFKLKGLEVTKFDQGGELSTVEARKKGAPADTAPAVDTAPTAGGSGIVATGSEAPGSILHKDKIDRLNFYARYRKLFNPRLKQTQVDGYNAILDEWESNSDLQDLRWLAYMLATAYHETGRRIEPVREGFAKTDKGAVNAVTKLFNKGRIKKNYALADPPGSGLHYFGRGLVQLTHRFNYLKMGNLLGLGTQLVSNPSLALNLEMSAKILATGMVKGAYTGKKLSGYFNKSTEQWGNARKIVNGLDKSALIAGYGRNFHRCLTGHGF